jgi:formate-dependent nitrite reductase membrane component NrfD
VLAGVFTAITGALLIADLKQPSRFLFILTKSNTESWLVRGAWILGAFAAVVGLWGLLDLVGSNSALPWLSVPIVILSAGVAGYTAFLFGQCEGRDLWQTPLLLPTLLAQAVVAGGSTYLVLDLLIDVPELKALRITTLAGLGALTFLIATEIISKGSRTVELATLEMTKGAYAQRFWIGGVLAGLVAPIVLIALALNGTAPQGLGAIAAICALVGLFSYEDAFVRAGQSVPLS